MALSQLVREKIGREGKREEASPTGKLLTVSGSDWGNHGRKTPPYSLGREEERDF